MMSALDAGAAARRRAPATPGADTAAFAQTGAIQELLPTRETAKCLIKYVPPIAGALQRP